MLHFFNPWYYLPLGWFSIGSSSKSTETVPSSIHKTITTLEQRITALEKNSTETENKVIISLDKRISVLEKQMLLSEDIQHLPTSLSWTQITDIPSFANTEQVSNLKNKLKDLETRLSVCESQAPFLQTTTTKPSSTLRSVKRDISKTKRT